MNLLMAEIMGCCTPKAGGYPEASRADAPSRGGRSLGLPREKELGREKPEQIGMGHPGSLKRQYHDTKPSGAAYL